MQIAHQKIKTYTNIFSFPVGVNNSYATTVPSTDIFNFLQLFAPIYDNSIEKK